MVDHEYIDRRLRPLQGAKQFDVLGERGLSGSTPVQKRSR